MGVGIGLCVGAGADLSILVVISGAFSPGFDSLGLSVDSVDGSSGKGFGFSWIFCKFQRVCQQGVPHSRSTFDSRYVLLPILPTNNF